MSDKRYSDPFREIVERLINGAGSDTLLLSCGHTIAVDHKAKHPKRKRCHGCRVWHG